MLVLSKELLKDVDLVKKLDSLELKEIWAEVDLEIDEALESQTPKSKQILARETIETDEVVDLKVSIDVKEALENEKVTIKNYKDTIAYQMAFDTAMRIIQLSKKIPVKKNCSLTDRIRSSSRSVCTYFAEAWKQSHIDTAFITNLNQSWKEVKKTQVWIEFALQYSYIDAKIARELNEAYDRISGMLVKMIDCDRQVS